jgi:hypothetical protein
MSIGFPTNTVVLIIAAMIGTGAGVWLSLSQGLRQVLASAQARRLWRWGTAIVLIAWLLVRLALSVYPPRGAVLGAPIIITFLVVGLLAGTLPLLISPVFRQIVRAIPDTWLVGIQAIRVAGFLFLALMDMKLLPAEFALPAGYGDITVGLLALGVVYLLATRKPYARALAIGWNVLGLLDLVSALTRRHLLHDVGLADELAGDVVDQYTDRAAIIRTDRLPLRIRALLSEVTQCARSLLNSCCECLCSCTHGCPS